MVVGFCAEAAIDRCRDLAAAPATSGCFAEVQFNAINDVMLYAWANFEQEYD
jgi:hypothetical protein